MAASRGMGEHDLGSLARNGSGCRMLRAIRRIGVKAGWLLVKQWHILNNGTSFGICSKTHKKLNHRLFCLVESGYGDAGSDYPRCI